MRRLVIASHWILFSSLCLSVCPRPCRADDASELKALVERFFALYQKENLDGFMALWSEKSPDYASRKEAMRQLFAANDFTFENLVITGVKVQAGKASLRASMDMTTRRANQPASQPTTEKLIRNLAFVKEGEAWNVWRDAPARG